MGWLSDILYAEDVARDPASERWWTSGPGAMAQSGAWVGVETALQASPVWACVRLISESIAMLPIIVYRRLSDGGKERAPGHPLYELLHDAPNEQQTAFAWKRVMMVHALLWGAGYSLIVPGPRGAVDRLEPIHPDTIRLERLPGGGRRYQVRGDDGVERPVNEEDVFVLPGLSIDGVEGLSLIRYARESIGLSLAAQSYSARFYSQGARPGGVLESAKPLSPEAAERLRQRWQAAHSGPHNAHQVAVLTDGVTWRATGMTHEAAQLIEQLDWSVADIARFFNVPLHMIQQVTKTTSWGSGIEEMGIEFVTYTLLPWIRNIEQAITQHLIVAPQAYFAEFLLESLLRGKLLDRYHAYAIGRQWGWLSRNDIRRLENMNPIPGGDDYLSPLNMQQLGSESAPAAALGHYHLLLQEAAARVVRKELAAMSRAARRFAGDPDGWRNAVEEFYAEHVEFVRQTLGVPRAAAERYASQQVRELLQRGAAAMDDWEIRRVADLVALAMTGGIS